MSVAETNHRLMRWIVVGLVVGVVLGLVTHWLPAAWQAVLTDDVYNLIGQLFLRLITMLVVPIVFVSLLWGAQSLTGRALGQVGLRALVLYVLTTVIAITIALLVADLLSLGKGADLSAAGQALNLKAPSWFEVVINMVPTNPFAALVNGNMLAVIVFSLLVGLAIAGVKDRAPVVAQFVEQAQTVLVYLMKMIMVIAPIGVAALLAQVFAKQGFALIQYLLAYFLVVIVVLLIQAVGVYSLFLSLFARLSPWVFFRKMRAAMLFAFGVSSSVASIPLVLQIVRERLGVRSKVAAFVIPLGATINMDGTAIMQGVATVFIAHAFGLSLSIGQYVVVILMATLASIGTAGVPSVGLITLAMVLKQVGLPVEGIALIVGVDRLLDMLRTAVNVSGDAMITTVIAKQVGALDQKTFEARD
jgi:Na+/H+-dicarboxylate symporter